jgi:hypothetical protein
MPNFEDTCKRLGVSTESIDLNDPNQLPIKKSWRKKSFLL